MVLGDDLIVERARGAGRCGVQPADDLGNIAGVPPGIARIDALGRERHIEIGAGLEAANLEHWLQHFVRRPRIGGRLENDELAGTQRRRNGFDGLDHVREVGALGLPERRRHADVDGVHGAKLAHVGRRTKPPRLDYLRQVGVGNVGDVVLPRVDLLDFRLVDVKPGDVESSARELNG